jgi:Protein of unknown function (DUF2569)
MIAQETLQLGSLALLRRRDASGWFQTMPTSTQVESQLPVPAAEGAEEHVAVDQLGPAEAAPQLSHALPIGGWLWLPAISLVLSAGRVFIAGLGSLRSLIEREHLAVAASVPGLPHSPRSLGLLFFAGYQLAYFVALVWLAARFARRKRNVPALMIGLHLFNLASLGVLFALGQQSVVGVSATVATIVTAAIWVPYFALSDRVKRTFLR